MADTKRKHWSVGARSEIGLVRSENQDRMSRVRALSGDIDVYIVADGMGGHKAGAQAAEITVQTLERELSAVPPNDGIREAVREAFQRANEAVYRQAHGDDPGTEGMGATAVALIVSPVSAFVAHVGDSRAYRFRKGRLERLTRDHSRVQRMIDAGMLSEQEAEGHPDAGVIERAMGDQPSVEVEIGPLLPVKLGDEFLLCSDGLCGYVDDRAIAEILSRGGSPQGRVEALVDLSLEKGGYDNVTVQLVRYGEPTPVRQRAGFLAATMIGFASLAVASTALFLVYNKLAQRIDTIEASIEKKLASQRDSAEPLATQVKTLEAKLDALTDRVNKVGEAARPGPPGERNSPQVPPEKAVRHKGQTQEPREKTAVNKGRTQDKGQTQDKEPSPPTAQSPAQPAASPPPSDTPSPPDPQPKPSEAEPRSGASSGRGEQLNQPRQGG